MKSPLGLEARLPIFDLFKDAVFLLWAKRGRLVSMFLPIIVVLVVLRLFSSSMGASFLEAIDAMDIETEGWPDGTGSLIVVVLVSLLLSVLFATTVHRFSLQDASIWPKNALRVPAVSDWRYLFRTIQVIALATLASVFTSTVGMVVIAIITGAQTPEALTQYSQVLNILIVILMLYVFARLSVTLPEIAIGTQGSGIERAWKMSKGNGFRLIIVVIILPFLVALPFLLLYQFDNLVMTVLASFGAYSMTLISFTVLSLSYQFLLEFYEPQDGESIQPETSSSDDSLDA
jgi:hypothetical protein